MLLQAIVSTAKRCSLQALAVARVDFAIGGGPCLPGCSLFCPTDDLAVATAGPSGAALLRMDTEGHTDTLKCVGSCRAVSGDSLLLNSCVH